MGYVDEVTNCLNRTGALHYFCEGGTQLFLPLAGVRAVTKARKAAKFAKQKLMANPYVQALNPKLVNKLPKKARQKVYTRLDELNQNTETIKANATLISNNRVTITQNTAKTAEIKDMASVLQYNKNAATLAENTVKLKNNTVQITEMKNAIKQAHREMNKRKYARSDSLFKNRVIDKLNDIEKEMLPKIQRLEIENKALKENAIQLSRQNTALAEKTNDIEKFMNNAKLVQQTQQLRTANQSLIAKNTDIQVKNNQIYSELNGILQNNPHIPSTPANTLSDKLRHLQNTDNAVFNQTRAILTEGT